jgi:hypothetical protein
MLLLWWVCTVGLAIQKLFHPIDLQGLPGYLEGGLRWRFLASDASP